MSVKPLPKLSITLRRSLIGHPRKHREVIRSLGLRRIRHTVIRSATPQVRGAVKRMRHLIDVKEVSS